MRGKGGALGTVSEEPNQVVPASWKRIPVKRSFVALGRRGNYMGKGKGRLCLPGVKRGRIPGAAWHIQSRLPGEIPYYDFHFLLSLTRDYLGASQQFFWDSSQPWPSQELSASNRYCPHAVSGHRMGPHSHASWMGEAQPPEPGSEKLPDLTAKLRGASHA